LGPTGCNGLHIKNFIREYEFGKSTGSRKGGETSKKRGWLWVENYSWGEVPCIVKGTRLFVLWAGSVVIKKIKNEDSVGAGAFELIMIRQVHRQKVTHESKKNEGLMGSLPPCHLHWGGVDNSARNKRKRCCGGCLQ